MHGFFCHQVMTVLHYPFQLEMYCLHLLLLSSDLYLLRGSNRQEVN